jgi:YesN/AraC family two-component response regulator
VKQIPRTAGDFTGSGFDILRVNAEQYFVVFIGSPSQTARYLCVVPYQSLFRDIELFNTAFPLFCAGIFLLFLFVTVRLTKDISRPIVRLAEEMKNIESEDFTQAKLSLNGYTRRDEIGVLYSEFTLMLDKIENLINDNYRKQLLIKDAQYKTLQAQINPHFLYNTLEELEKLIDECCSTVVRWNFEQFNSRKSRLVEKLKSKTRENLTRPELTLKWLAQTLVYANVDYLSKLFKRETGETFKHYLTRLRVEEAKNLLQRSPGIPVAEVARRAGFGENARYFCTVFRKCVGQPPAEYRRSHRRVS